jgi:serine protease inhibitor
MKNLLYLLFIPIFLISCEVVNEPVTIAEDAQPIVLKTNQQLRVNQDNAFAFELLKSTIAESNQSNVFVSPLSVSIALGMAWNGAQGETKTEMEVAMKMAGLSTDEINDYYKIMQSTLPTIDPSTKLSIANSLWYRQGFPVKNDFLKVNSDNFGAYVRELDFAKTWAVDTINKWCSDKTNKLIPTILEEIPQESMMYLVNAVYFKGIWRNKFDKKETSERYFTNELDQKSKVNTMYQKDAFAYYSDELAQYVDLPYGNKAFSMTVILPAENKTTSDVLNSLTAENWTSTLDQLHQREILLYLPRFKVENKFTLNNGLQAMGMKLAFTENADFSKISDIKLFISKVIHKTYVAVDEEGTEAAAVTAFEFTSTSIPTYPIVDINKPFLFVIRENSTGVILFIGKMGAIEKY